MTYTETPAGWGLFNVEGRADGPLLLSNEHAAEIGATPHQPGTDGVKEPTIAEVLEAVGDDPALAAQALDAENAKDTPRKGLVSELEKRLA